MINHEHFYQFLQKNPDIKAEVKSYAQDIFDQFVTYCREQSLMPIALEQGEKNRIWL